MRKCKDCGAPVTNPEKTGHYCHRCRKYYEKYKIRTSDYNRILEKQGHKCAICGTTEKTTVKTAAADFVVDHCHKTGTIRGLLCVNCNTGIGSLMENTLIFSKALVYLEESIANTCSDSGTGST